MAPSDTTATCDLCGRQVSGPAALLTWSSAVEEGRSRLFCDSCSRTHVRSMEAKLDSEHW